MLSLTQPEPRSLIKSSQPKRPKRIYGRMRDSRCPHPALLTPRSPIEDPRQRSKQDISPVEVHCALVEVRDPKQNSSRQQRPVPPEPPLQKVLHPAAKEELHRNRDKEEREDPSQHHVRHRRNICVEMQKTKPQSKRDRDGSIDRKLAPASPQIRQPKPKIEADALQPTDRKKPINSRIQQQHLVEHSQMRRPCRLKPAQIHRQTKNSKNKKVTPVSPLCRVGNARPIKQQSNRHRQEQVQDKPAQSKLPKGNSNHPIRHAQHQWQHNAKRDRQPLN